MEFEKMTWPSFVKQIKMFFFCFVSFNHINLCKPLYTLKAIFMIF